MLVDMQFRIGVGIENCAPRKRNAHFRILSDSFGFESERLFFGTPQAKRKLSDSRTHVRIPFGLESERFFEGLLKQNADFGFVHRLGFIIFNEPDPTTRSGMLACLEGAEMGH